MTKTGIIAVAVPLFAACCVWGGLKFSSTGAAEPEKTPERAVKLFRVSSADTFGTIAYPGRVKAKTHADLFFRVSGPVIENDLELGMEVRKGSLLMRIDPRDYEREVERLTHNLAMLDSKLRYQEQEYRRMAQLVKSNAVSKANYESALSSRDAVAAEIKAQETALRIAKDKLADTRLTAPFNGRITELKIEKFEMAKADEVVVSLQNLEELEVVVHIPEGNIPQLHRLGSGGFRGKSFPVVFPGRDLRHSARLEEFRPVISAENGTYELRFAMTQPADFLILPGMTAEVRNLPGRRGGEAKRPLIPFAALFKKDGGQFVWEYDPVAARLTRRRIEAGSVHGDFVETDSLPAGILIVAAGGAWLDEGSRVAVLNPEVLHAAD